MRAADGKQFIISLVLSRPFGETTEIRNVLLEENCKDKVDAITVGHTSAANYEGWKIVLITVAEVPQRELERLRQSNRECYDMLGATLFRMTSRFSPQDVSRVQPYVEEIERIRNTLISRPLNGVLVDNASKPIA